MFIGYLQLRLISISKKIKNWKFRFAYSLKYIIYAQFQLSDFIA